jgi:hypothetical protein
MVLLLLLLLLLAIMSCCLAITTAIAMAGLQQLLVSLQRLQSRNHSTSTRGVHPAI